MDSGLIAEMIAEYIGDHVGPCCEVMPIPIINISDHDGHLKQAISVNENGIIKFYACTICEHDEISIYDPKSLPLVAYKARKCLFCTEVGDVMLIIVRDGKIEIQRYIDPQCAIDTAKAVVDDNITDVVVYSFKDDKILWPEIH